MFSQKKPWGLGDREEEEHKYWEEAVDRNSKGAG